MKIYVDGVILLNFLIDFIILMTVNIILKRNSNIKKIIMGSLFGSLTVLILFIKVSSTNLFIIKVIFSFIMILISFGFKDIKYFIQNFLYFYNTSFVFGGILYYLNIKFSYKNIGMIFYYKKISINYIFIIVCALIIMYIYVKQLKQLKNYYSLNYNVKVFIKDKKYNFRGYLDTANRMREPYTNKLVIVTNDKYFKKHIRGMPVLLVPFDTIDNHGLLKCVVPKKVIIEKIGTFKNVVIGITNKKFNMEGINCILNAYLIK